MNLTPDAGVQPSDAEIIKIAETLGKHEPGVSNYDSWGPLGYRLDENGEYTIPVVPGNVLPFARALISRFGTRPAAEPTQGGSAGEAIAHVVADPDGSNKRVAFYSNRALWETPLWTKLYALSARSPEAQGEPTPAEIACFMRYVDAYAFDYQAHGKLAKSREDVIGALRPLCSGAAPTPAEPAPLTPEEHQVLRSAVRDSAEVVAPGRMEEPAHPAWCSCGACNAETVKTERELDLYDEIECDLPYLFGRASLEGHEAGQRLAKAVREKMQRARLSTPPTPEAKGTFACPLCGKDTPHHHPGAWTLTAPDGRQWHGDSPIKACREEQRSRIPDAVAFERVMSEAGPVPVHNMKRHADGSETCRHCGLDLAAARTTPCTHVMYPTPAQQDTKAPRMVYNDDGFPIGYATPPAEKQAAPTWTPDQVQQVEKEAESMLGKLQASPQAPRDDLGVALFCDLKTDEEKYNFFLFGRGYETGVIAHALQNDVAMAYKRCAEYRKLLASMQAAPSGEASHSDTNQQPSETVMPRELSADEIRVIRNSAPVGPGYTTAIIKKAFEWGLETAARLPGDDKGESPAPQDTKGSGHG